MSLTALTEAILSEANTQAHAIAEAASVRVRAEQQVATSELQHLEEEIIAHAHIQAEKLARAIHQQAQLPARALILRAKQEELDTIKRAFVEHLLLLPPADSKKILSALTALVPKEKGEIVKGNKEKGGFIYKGKHVEMNLTYAYLADRLFSKYRAELARELFAA